MKGIYFVCSFGSLDGGIYFVCHGPTALSTSAQSRRRRTPSRSQPLPRFRSAAGCAARVPCYPSCCPCCQATNEARRESKLNSHAWNPAVPWPNIGEKHCQATNQALRRAPRDRLSLPHPWRIRTSARLSAPLTATPTVQPTPFRSPSEFKLIIIYLNFLLFNYFYL